MSFSKLRSACPVILLLIAAGCSREGVAYRRVAVPPFENLSGDPGLDWMGPAFSQALVLGITGAPTIEVFGIATQREPGAATGTIRGYFSRVGERLRVSAVLANTETGRVSKSAIVSGAQAEGLLKLARAISIELAGFAGPLLPTQDAALRLLVSGGDTSDPAAAGKAYEAAVAADPDFGAAYAAWAQWLAARGDRAGAQQVIEAAAKRGSRIPQIARDRLALLGAILAGEPSAQYLALVALSRSTPADSQLFRNLAELDLRAHRYPAAVEWYKQAIVRRPAEPLLFNEMGYAQAYARDLPGAVETLGRYRQMRPEEANPLDSLGDVHYYLGRFAEAGKYYEEAYAKSPTFLGGGELYKNAWARLMSGDVAGAGQIFGKYLEARRGDPMLPYRRAEWEYHTGRRREAMARLLEFAGKQPGGAPQASLSWSQLAIWSLVAGQRDLARDYAARAAAAAGNSPARPLAEICRFLVQPAAPAAEWKARADKTFPQPALAGLKSYSLGYALLLNGEFADAEPVLRQLYAQTLPSSSEPINVLLAWTQIETRRISEAAPLLDVYPVPHPGSDQPFYCLAFPRLFALRAACLRQQGRQEDAAASLDLFKKLGGTASSPRSPE